MLCGTLVAMPWDICLYCMGNGLDSAGGICLNCDGDGDVEYVDADSPEQVPAT